jgi:hypothetical protein
MTDNPEDLVQFASDVDGDLHLFPKNLDEPNYHCRWDVWIVCKDGTREPATPSAPTMCIDKGRLSNPYGLGQERAVAGWLVELNFRDVSKIEISIDSGPPILIKHPRCWTE